MDSATLAKLRPIDESADAIRTAIAAVSDERAAATHRAGALTAERTKLLLTATTSAIAKAEAAIREAMVDKEQLDAMSTALAPLLAAAEEREADAAHAELVREAAEATEKFNEWLATEYAPHAAAIAAGIALERQATQLRERLRDPRTGAMPENLPPMARAFVGLDGRALGFMVRLPAVAPGVEPPAWPR